MILCWHLTYKLIRCTVLKISSMAKQKVLSHQKYTWLWPLSYSRHRSYLKYDIAKWKTGSKTDTPNSSLASAHEWKLFQTHMSQHAPHFFRGYCSCLWGAVCLSELRMVRDPHAVCHTSQPTPSSANLTQWPSSQTWTLCGLDLV